MQHLIMDMPLMISVARWHAADRHGKTEEVALAIEGTQPAQGATYASGQPIL